MAKKAEGKKHGFLGGSTSNSAATPLAYIVPPGRKATVSLYACLQTQDSNSGKTALVTIYAGNERATPRATRAEGLLRGEVDERNGGAMFDGGVVFQGVLPNYSNVSVAGITLSAGQSVMITSVSTDGYNRALCSVSVYGIEEDI